MSQFFQHIAQHLAAYGFGSGLLILGLITTMPESVPVSFQDFWTWMRHALQTAVPAARQKPTQPQGQNQTGESAQ